MENLPAIEEKTGGKQQEANTERQRNRAGWSRGKYFRWLIYLRAAVVEAYVLKRARAT